MSPVATNLTFHSTCPTRNFFNKKSNPFLSEFLSGNSLISFFAVTTALCRNNLWFWQWKNFKNRLTSTKITLQINGYSFFLPFCGGWSVFGYTYWRHVRPFVQADPAAVAPSENSGTTDPYSINIEENAEYLRNPSLPLNPHQAAQPLNPTSSRVQSLGGYDDIVYRPVWRWILSLDC